MKRKLLILSTFAIGLTSCKTTSHTCDAYTINDHQVVKINHAAGIDN